MAIARKFLGFEQPGLWSAADALLASARGPLADLRDVIVVVPGRRAGRRLLEVLVERAAQRRLQLRPPRIETVGRLPEHLYQPKRPFADELVQKLAWVQVLREAPADALSPLVPHPPGDEVLRWLELGEMLRRRHVELAADRLDFRAVARHVAQLGGADERRRWQTMVALQDGYHRLLDNLELWDRQTARLKAIELGECQTTCQVVVLGTVDMNVTLRAMLDQVADRVTALVVAPDRWRARFDEHGCLIPAAWQDQVLDLDDEQIEIADGLEDQALAAVRQITRYGGRYEAGEVTIGVPDEQLIPHLERELNRRGVPARWGPGRPLGETGPFRLLAALAPCLQHRRFRDWAALVRHPDVMAWFEQRSVPSGWLTGLDRYQRDQLPHRLPAQSSAGGERPPWRTALVHLESLVRRLGGEKLRLSEWTEPLLGLLAEIYGQRSYDRMQDADQATILSCQLIRDALESHLTVPESLAPLVSVDEAIRLALESIAGQTVPPKAEDAVELLGWLELPLDDAPALILTGVNEGLVPESVNTDLFLPNALRARLGMLDNLRRYARDVYALSVLRATRRSLHLISGRKNRDGEPLAPSRLLFAAAEETAARRALRCFRPPPAAPSASATAARKPSVLAVPPKPQPLERPPDRLSVTSFRDYLACPYRFYLRHMLKLETIDDHAEELDPAAFGVLVHEVLSRFGQASARDSADADEIRGVLRRELNRYARGVFGADTAPSVRVQIEQAGLRLDTFAQRQAEWAAKGWRIEHTEVPHADHKDAFLQVDGQVMILTGRIDRIDVHQETGERVILDYKTSDGAQRPDQAHRKQGQWVDLQLPLYRHLARALDIAMPVQLGYVLLPKDTGKTSFAIAAWSDDELRQADLVAEEVVRRVRGQQFWPPAISADIFPQFAAICREGVVDRRSGP